MESKRKKRPQPRGVAPKKPGPGRDSHLSIARLRKIIGAIQLGNYVNTACLYAGIAQSTYYNWRDRGDIELDRVHSLPRVNLEHILEEFEGPHPDDVDEDGRPLPGVKPRDRGSVEYMWSHRPRQFQALEWPYVIFSHLTARAQAAAEVRHVSTIMTAANAGEWRASLAWLERTRPETYGRVDRLKVGGDEKSGPVKTSSVVTVDQLMGAIRQNMKPGEAPEEGDDANG